MLGNPFVWLGKAVCNSVSSWRETFIFWGEIAASLGLLICHPRKLRWSSFCYYLDMCGALALPIVLLICFLMGVTIAFQAAIQMQKFGTEVFVADLVGFSMLKEFGPLMVAIIATGRAGSAFAAEIGTMKVNEEIYALKTLGVVPEAFLVLPKLLAMLIVMPLLTVFADTAGLLGGLVIGTSFLDIPCSAYIERTFNVLDEVTFLLGVLKALFFSILITLAGCYCGFQAAGDAQGVGRGATKAVVASIFLVIVADAVLTLLYSLAGY